jgi:adenosylmethionine-8-amino-7-oxononanoate aminotransferase
LSCSVANRSIDLLLSSDWESRILQIENILKSELFPLKKQKLVSDVRIIGAIGVIEFKSPLDMKVVQEKLIKNGVWLRPYGKLLYTMPPYVINDEELLTITKAMKAITHNF